MLSLELLGLVLIIDKCCLFVFDIQTYGPTIIERKKFIFKKDEFLILGVYTSVDYKCIDTNSNHLTKLEGGIRELDCLPVKIIRRNL